MHPQRSYGIPICVEIAGDVDWQALAEAWHGVLEQYRILTARIVEGEVLQHRLDEGGKSTLRREQLECGDGAELLENLQERVSQPFDLNDGPLTRIDLLTRRDRPALLLIVVHHIIFDETSSELLLDSLFAFYRDRLAGRPLAVSKSLPGYWEFVAWEDHMLASAEGRAHAEYWRGELRGAAPGSKRIPAERRSPAQCGVNRMLRERLPGELTNWVREFAASHGLEPPAIWLAALQLLLHKYTDQTQVVVVVPAMRRPLEIFEREIGCFFNLIPIVTTLKDQLTFADLVRSAQETLQRARRHSNFPFSLMLEREQKCGESTDFEVFYAHHGLGERMAGGSGSLPDGPSFTRVNGLPQNTEEGFGLAVEIYENGEGSDIRMQGNTELYAGDSIGRMYGHYCALLGAIRMNPGRNVHEHSIVTEDERNLVLFGFNATRVDYPKGACIHDLIAERATRDPDRTAAMFGDQSLTYGELHDRSRDLALYLQSLGVGPERVVGLCVERSLDMLVGLLAILQAGGAYVPLDPEYPSERLAYMLEDSRAAWVLTEAKWRERLSVSAAADTRLVVLDQQRTEIANRVAQLKVQNVELRRDVKPHHLAYVIYTSGSTGRPKGVAIEHRSTVALVNWVADFYGRGEWAGVLAAASICFDMSVFEIIPTLASGGKLVLAANTLALAEVSHRDCITLITTVPSAMEQLLRLGPIPNSVRTINLGGEALSANLVDRIYDNSSVERVYDLYGPTEITCCSTYVLRSRNARQTIGRPIANTRIYILDPYGNPQPRGVVGELYIAGDGLARGYLNRAQLTQERFVENPFVPGTRMYRTGDLARWQDDGSIDYLGRVDSQVKIRGVRIELGEIETRLNQHPEINDCVVVAQGRGSNKQLVAFYRAKQTRTDRVVHLASDDLQAYLQRTLPAHMLPAKFVSLASIPLTPNAKVDRHALENTDVNTESSQTYVATRNDTERQLVELWAEVLDIEPGKIGVNDNFFELGGHSMSAILLVTKTNKRLKQSLPLAALAREPTVAGLTRLILSTK
jgi:amino acid adenylation domain-containing protein